MPLSRRSWSVNMITRKFHATIETELVARHEWWTKMSVRAVFPGFSHSNGHSWPLQSFYKKKEVFFTFKRQKCPLQSKMNRFCAVTDIRDRMILSSSESSLKTDHIPLETWQSREFLFRRAIFSRMHVLFHIHHARSMLVCWNVCAFSYILSIEEQFPEFKKNIVNYCDTIPPDDTEHRTELHWEREL